MHVAGGGVFEFTRNLGTETVWDGNEKSIENRESMVLDFTSVKD